MSMDLRTWFSGLALVLAGCAAQPAKAPAAADADAGARAVAELRAAINELGLRPEHDASEVTVQHVLIGVGGTGLPGVDRTPEEAERIAAQVFAAARAGTDFETLVKNHSDDAAPGIYSMCTGKPSGSDVYARSQLAPAFGDIAWRLEVGEVGVAPFDGEQKIDGDRKGDGNTKGTPPRSPFGYHVIKRLK